MPLMMARPSKHPKTGIYQFRPGGPTICVLVGKSEEKQRLGTRADDGGRAAALTRAQLAMLLKGIA